MKAHQLESVLDQTRDSDAETRRVAVRGLCPCALKRNARAAWDRLLEMTGDPDLAVRRNVFHVLCDGSPNDRRAEVVTALEAMRDDSAPRLRRQVRKVLARHRRTGRVNFL